MASARGGRVAHGHAARRRGVRRRRRPGVLFWKMLATASGAVSKKAFVERQGKACGTPKGGDRQGAGA
jgi:hypothetical protein